MYSFVDSKPTSSIRNNTFRTNWLQLIAACKIMLDHIASIGSDECAKVSVVTRGSCTATLRISQGSAILLVVVVVAVEFGGESSLQLIYVRARRSHVGGGVGLLVPLVEDAGDLGQKLIQ